MEFKFNNDAREKRIQDLVSLNLAKIQYNLSKGLKDTELYIDKEVASEVKELIEKELPSDFGFCIVNRGVNQYTSKPVSYISMTIGDDKYYKVRYYGN